MIRRRDINLKYKKAEMCEHCDIIVTFFYVVKGQVLTREESESHDI